MYLILMGFPDVLELIFYIRYDKNSGVDGCFIVSQEISLYHITFQIITSRAIICKKDPQKHFIYYSNFHILKLKIRER